VAAHVFGFRDENRYAGFPRSSCRELRSAHRIELAEVGYSSTVRVSEWELHGPVRPSLRAIGRTRKPALILNENFVIECRRSTPRLHEGRPGRRPGPTRVERHVAPESLGMTPHTLILVEGSAPEKRPAGATKRQASLRTLKAAHRVFWRRRGVRTLACRVETYLDAWSASAATEADEKSC